MGAERTLFRTGWPFLAFLLIPPALGYIRRGFVFGDWGSGILAFVISAGFAYAVWHGLLARTTECRSKVYNRCDQPARYWGTLVVWGIAYALSTSSLFFAG